MAIDAGTLWEMRATATANMVNGGGFNINNANFISDFTTDSNTANTSSPVLSSASYSFVAADANAWIFVAFGTNWTKGFYPIGSVSGGKATINAAVGAGLIANPVTGAYDSPSTVAGIATTGTPTGGTIGIDYSQQDAADGTATDFTATGSSTTLTSATGGFRRSHIGNFFHQTTTGTGAFGVVGWYEIVSYTNATTVVLDRTPNSGTANVACTGFVGGALDMAGSLGDSFLEQIQGGNTVWYKSGSFTVGVAVAVASANSTSQTISYLRGFTSLRGDTCTGTNRPTLAMGSNSFTVGTYVQTSNISFTGTAATLVTSAIGAVFRNCKFQNTSTTTSRIACTISTDALAVDCEVISQNGTGISTSAANVRVIGCYVHDSTNGLVSTGTGRQLILSTIISENVTTAINNSLTNASLSAIGCTFYGSEAKIGTALSAISAVILCQFFDNIIYGFATGISQATTQYKSNFGMYNNFYNNTTDVSLYTKDVTDTAVNPAFTSVSQITGTNATTSGSVLTSSGANFSSVTDNQDYCYISAGTGKTVGKYLITAHTSTTLTLNNAPGTNATADGVYSVGIGHNFKPTVSLPGFPATFPGGLIPGGLTVGAEQIGAVQAPFGGGSSTIPSFTFG